MAYADAFLTSYGDVYGSASRTDIYANSYSQFYGVPFPQAPLDVAVELDLGGTWTPVTHDVYQRDGTDAVTITRGRADEMSQCNPGTLAMELNNRNGKYSPRNPLSPLYGQFGRNTPARVSVPSLETFLRLENDTVSGAQCQDAAPLDITGSIDVRVDVNLSSYMPCVLASKWALTGTTPGSPGMTVGSTCNQSCYPGSGSQIGAARVMDGIVGRPLAETAQKVFFETGTTTTFPSTPLAKDKGLMDAKVQLWLCYKPLPDGSQLSQLTTSINAYLAYAAGAGAPQPKIVLWQEPQNSSNVALGLPNAAAYKTCMKNHYAAIKALAGSPQVVYCSASHLGETGVSAWYPGDAYCDELAQDLYGYTWKHGTTLATLASLANAASPPKPVSHAEAGTALSQSQADTMSQADVTNYINYSIGFFQGRAASGLPNGAWMWFNGLGPNWNTLQHGDFRIGLLDTLYDALTAGTGGVASNSRSWALTLNGDGTLSFWWTTDGTLATLNVATSSAPVPLGRATLRARGTATAPIGVTFYAAPGGSAGAIGDGAPWAQLGSSVSLASLHIFSGSAPLAVGYNGAFTADKPAYGGPSGQVFGFQLRSFAGNYSDVYADAYGVPLGGIVVADAAFTSQQAGATGWTDSVANSWELNGSAEISQRSYRVHAEMSSLPTQWDTSGADVWSPVEAGGLLRRLSQGTQPPVNSAFTRAVLGLAGALAPVAYWPCEDAAGAGQLGPAIGIAPLTFTIAPQLAADSGFACSLPIPTVGFGQWTGPVAAYTGGSAVVVRFLMHVPASNSIADDSIICRVNTTGTIGDATLKWKTGGQLRFTGYGNGAFQWDTGASASFAVNGQLLLVSIELTQSGSKLNWQLAVLQAGQSTPVTVNGTVNSAAPGNVTSVHFGLNSTSLSGSGLGQVFVQTAYEPLTDFAGALAAHAGETCASRFYRLCTENSIGVRIYGAPLLDVAMGAQQPGTLASLLQLCEATGRGLLYEPRQALALGYRTVRALCQQPARVTADYSAAHLGDGQQGLIPVEDDQHTVNDVTVSSASGGSFRATLTDGSAMSVSPPPAGVGPYGNSYTAAVSDDSQLPGIAGWILHGGTVAEDRYPVIPFHLARDKAAPVFYPVQSADIGDRLDIISTPAFLPPGPVRQLAYGATEVLGGQQYRVAFNAVPESPYEVGVYADPVYGRMGADGSALDADIGTGDTIFTVDVTGPSGLPWTTAAADFPFDVLCGGEQMTVTAIAGPPVNFLTGDDATFAATAGHWVAGAGCTVAWTNVVSLVPGGGSLAMTSSGTGTMTALSCAPGNILTQGLAVSPGDTVKLTALLKAATAGRFVAAAIDWYTSGGVFLSTSIGTALIDGAGAFWSQAVATFSAPASAAFAAADLQVATTALDGGTIHYVGSVFFGNVTAGGSPQQQFTVIRSVNGIVKAHPAGEPVALAHPAIIALA